ncbi:hypothetical protein RRG08_063385 [Elysia crispata]|uniref:Uncharacterized protein n=1 Tax=Elysia crispata TaxID=231223 RepID=A0AAE1E8L6_9GAST|nr:hypothetical protein RRG08_063385 [Elysia crispata]
MKRTQHHGTVMAAGRGQKHNQPISLAFLVSGGCIDWLIEPVRYKNEALHSLATYQMQQVLTSPKSIQGALPGAPVMLVSRATPDNKHDILSHGSSWSIACFLDTPPIRQPREY